MATSATDRLRTARGVPGLERLTGHTSGTPGAWPSIRPPRFAGVGFTVSLLLASLAFTGARLDEARLSVLGAAALARALTCVVIRATELLPWPRRIRALVGGGSRWSTSPTTSSRPRDRIKGAGQGPHGG